MKYNASTVAMLRTILDELLVSEAFIRQNHCSAVDIAQYILHLASKGERDPSKIKHQIQSLLTPRVAAELLEINCRAYATLPDSKTSNREFS